MRKRKPNRERFVRAVERVARTAKDFDPRVASAAERLLTRIRDLPMSEILDKVPGETWVDKARAIGVTRMTLHGWRAGRCRPFPEQAERLAKITGFDADAIRGTVRQ